MQHERSHARAAAPSRGARGRRDGGHGDWGDGQRTMFENDSTTSAENRPLPPGYATIARPANAPVAYDAMLVNRILTTQDLAPRKRSVAWCDWIATLFDGLQSDLGERATFDGRLHTAQAGDVRFTRLEADRHRVIRQGPRPHDDGTGFLKIVAPWAGSAAIEQGGRRAWVQPGGWAIYDTTESYEVVNPDPSDHLIVMLPKAPLLAGGLPLGALMGRNAGGASGMSRVALEAMRNTFEELPRMTPRSSNRAGDLILEMVRLALLELVGEHPPVNQMAAFKRRIREFIAQRLRDPHLSIGGIAAALHCSKRHLHNAFADEDLTIAHYILSARLEACMRDLGSPAHAGRTITDIALSWGFNSAAHFSRAFHEHVGSSPSDFRRACLAGRRGLDRPSATASTEPAPAGKRRPGIAADQAARTPGLASPAAGYPTIGQTAPIDPIGALPR